MQLAEPEGEEPFKTKVDAPLGIDLRIELSERHYQFAVLYNPSDHRKVVIYDSDGGARMLEKLQTVSESTARSLGCGRGGRANGPIATRRPRS